MSDIYYGYTWWLRSSYYSNEFARDVTQYGAVNSCPVRYAFGVRPAITIPLTSSYVVKGEKTCIEVYGSEWDTISFGKYNDIPIIWRVLNISGDDAFLLADNILTTRAYNDEEKTSNWKDCSLRKWLNESFYNEAFNDKEKEMIKSETITSNSPINVFSYDIQTTDKVYLPSENDILQPIYGFPK